MISRYIAATIIPNPAARAYPGPSTPGYDGLPGPAVNVPIRQRNSPMNPLSPGSPTDDSTKKTMKNAHTGMRRASPLISFMSRVW